MRRTHLHVEPAVHQFLQARLAAKMFCRSVMSQHVFPGIDLEHMAFRRVRMRAVGLTPGEPPVVHRAFLLGTDIAVKSFCPGQRRHPVIKLDFPHEGSLHDGRGATRHFVSFRDKESRQITKFHIFGNAARFYTTVHRSSTIFWPTIHENATFVG